MLIVGKYTLHYFQKRISQLFNELLFNICHTTTGESLSPTANHIRANLAQTHLEADQYWDNYRHLISPSHLSLVKES